MDKPSASGPEPFNETNPFKALIPISIHIIDGMEYFGFLTAQNIINTTFKMRSIG